MENKPSLHFFCGKMAAGKTTLAKKLAQKYGAIYIGEDDWLTMLYPTEISKLTDYLNYSGRLKSLLGAHVQTLLSHGVSVVMDFPGNTIKQRNWFKGIYENTDYHHLLHYIEASDQLCKRQLAKRSQTKPDDAAFTSEKEFDEITKYFQAPSDAEGFNVKKYQPDQ